MIVEEWKDIPGYEGKYQASDQGNVRALPHPVRLVTRTGTECTRMSPGRMLRPGAQASGHVSVALGKYNSQSVHRLVLTTFIGPCPEGCEALHLNHKPADNRLTNLIWGPRSENIRMDYEVGTRVPKLSATGIRGLVPDKRTGRIKVYVRPKGVSIYIGTFGTLDEAVQAQKGYA